MGRIAVFLQGQDQRRLNRSYPLFSTRCESFRTSHHDNLIIECEQMPIGLAKAALDQGLGGSAMRKAIAWGVVCCVWVGTATGSGNGVAIAQAGPAQNAAIVLDHGWQFRQVRAEVKDADSGWLPATVPGDVHLDLLVNQKIADPYFRDNEAKLQWIGKESWEYMLTFDVTAALLARANLDLVFEGLDAASEVYVRSEAHRIQAR